MSSPFAALPSGPAAPAPGRDTSADARTLAELRQPGGRPVLITGATILSQDPAVGDHVAGEILIRDGKIAEVGANLARPADETIVIDAAGTDDQLVTLRLFDLDPSVEMWDFARREGLWMSHEMGTHIENVADVLADLDTRGLLTDKHAFNHCYGLPDKTWELIKQSGAAVNLCPRSDAAFGLGAGFPPIDQALAAGILPGLSNDNEISYALSMFIEMQILLNKHRGSVFGRILAGEKHPPEHLAPADILRFATVGGAANAGLSHKIGSLTPGKDADIVLIRTTDTNTAPGSNAVATVTAFAHSGNVDTVLVAGQVRKWRGELVGVMAGAGGKAADMAGRLGALEQVEGWARSPARACQAAAAKVIGAQARLYDAAAAETMVHLLLGLTAGLWTSPPIAPNPRWTP